MADEALISIVDEDESIRKATRRLIESVGIKVEQRLGVSAHKDASVLLGRIGRGVKSGANKSRCRGRSIA